MSAIGDALFGKTQQQVLGLLYGKPENSYYLNEIVRLANIGKGTVVRELEKLRAAGLITSTRRGNQIHFRANINNPVFDELRSIVCKTFGLVDVVNEALLPAFQKIDMAFIYGSIAKGDEHAESDIDVLIVADATSYTEIFDLLGNAERRLRRIINLSMYTSKEFNERRDGNQSFIQRVLNQPKIMLNNRHDLQLELAG